MDGGDGPHIRPHWQHRLRHLMEDIAHHARIGAGMIVWLQFIIANGLENEAVLIAVVDENLANGEGVRRAGAAAAVEHQIDMVVNQLLRAAARPQVDVEVNRLLGAAAEPQVDMEVNRPVEAAAEPQVDMEVNRPVEAAAEPQVDVEVNRLGEAEDPLPGGSSRRLSDAASDSDYSSDAEEEDPASVPSSSPVPGGSRKRSREEDDEGNERSSKQFRH
ncbi:uncharacterized protein LOC141752612 isoform X2 [Sebastes fasciatus]|uniref:uncharacterized protein LOC141752612 isoform X2 n=1 Tax=Sebastes fasciatus TaxID=394691 RepID=UPI003D9DFE37